MASAVIRINQATNPVPVGVAGVSRDDIILGAAVSLVNTDDVNVRSWRWELIDRPTGSVAALSDPLAASPQFTPDVVGSYLVQLTLDEGGVGKIQRRIVAVRDGSGFRLPAAAEANEANWGSNTRGWFPDLELFLKAIGSTNAASAWKQPARLATAAALPAHTRVSNVLTASANGALTVDGVAVAFADRILVRSEAASHLEHGIYTVTQVGSGGTPWILTRAADADTSARVYAGLSVTVTEGATHAEQTFVLITNNPITLNTTALEFTYADSDTLAEALVAGNTTGGTHIRLTGTDEVRGADGSGASAGTQATLRGGAATGTGIGGAALVQAGAPADGAGGAASLVASAGVGADKAGGAASVAAGAATGTGTGGSASVTAGAGGATGTAGTAAVTGGTGGSTSGTGGPVTVSGGAGGTSGVGGTVTVQGGNGTGTGNAGGGVIVQGGSAADGNGGGVTVTGRAGVGSNRNGGQATLAGNNATGAGSGGNTTIAAGSGGATGTAGAITMSGGTGGSTSGAGGAITVQGGAPFDGNGGAVQITGRNAATTTAANRNGGAVVVTAGNATVAGSGGSVGLTAGSGGTTGTAGNVICTGGAGGSTSGTGGEAQLNGGTPVDGNGGAVRIIAANGATITATNRNGGQAQVSAGNAVLAGSGGNATVTGGTGGATGTAGGVILTGGAGGSTSGSGGSVSIGGGTPTSGDGGSVTVSGSAGVGSDKAGGAVSVTGGAGTGVGAAGSVVVQAGTGASVQGADATLRGGSATGAAVSGGNAVVEGGVPTNGNGGWVQCIAADGVGTSRNGGQFVGQGGDATNAVQGGSASILGGGNTGTGKGGTAAVQGGPGGTTSGKGGDAQVLAGSVTSGEGGDVVITASNAAGGGNSDGGDITLTPGDKVNSATEGLIKHTKRAAFADGETLPTAVSGWAILAVDSGANGRPKLVEGDGAVEQLGNGFASQAMPVVDRETTDQDVVSSAAVTSVFTFQIPANGLGANGVLELKFIGDYLNNTGTDKTLTFIVRWGGNVVYQETTRTLATDATRRAIRWHVELANQNATNDQTGGGDISISNPGSTTTGLGDLNSTFIYAPIVLADAASDTTSAQTIQLEIQHSASDANLSFRKRCAWVKLSPSA